MLLRILQSLHGYAGVLAVAALVHPAWLLRRGKPLSRGARWSVALTAAMTSLAFGLGLTLYEPYRETLKRPLFASAPEIGWLFETKEHLAFAVICLTLGATAAAFLAPREDRRARQWAAAAFTTAAILALLTTALATTITATRSF